MDSSIENNLLAESQIISYSRGWVATLVRLEKRYPFFALKGGQVDSPVLSKRPKVMHNNSQQFGFSSKGLENEIDGQNR